MSASWSPGQQLGTSLADAHRQLITTQFQAKVAAGELRPLLVPQCLIGSWVLPILYLTIPHVRRPWLYRARFLVLAAVVLLNVETALHSSSPNFAIAYGTGLVASWGTIWAIAVLLCSRPQFEAERVAKRPRLPSQVMSPQEEQQPRSVAATANGRSGSSGHVGHTGSNGTSHDGKSEARRRRQELPVPQEQPKTAVGHEYYWQSFPADAPFLTRLDWVLDYYFAWRGSGWNTAIATIPRFDRPKQPLSQELVRVDSMPLASTTGCRRHDSLREFLWSRLGGISLGYLGLDFCGTLMTSGYDPYFITGDPGSAVAPGEPGSLQNSALLLGRYLFRTALCGVGLVSALEVVLTLGQVATLAFSRITAPVSGVRRELWQYPSIHGSFSHIQERGLAGFWSTWHQTFRIGFSAPGKWLARQGVIPAEHTLAGRLAVSFVAFFLSGALHFAGSFTAMRPTRPWEPWLFFVLSWLGVVVQTGGAALVRCRVRHVPRYVRRTANLLFVSTWMLATGWLFNDDISRAGAWLFEPVPFSIFRAFGYGQPGDSPWRWTGSLGGWHAGRHWWTSGYGL